MTILSKLDELQKIADAATPGPWATNETACYNTYPGVYLVLGIAPGTDAEQVVINDDEARTEDLKLIAASRTAVPQLIAALRVAHKALSDVEWHGPNDIQGKISAKAIARIAEILGANE